MTLIEELNAIYDYCKRFRLKVEIVKYDPNLITCCTTDRSPNGLRHVKRARRSISTTLFRVHQERELFAPLYSLR
jgi:hypothetical protein